MAKPTAKIDLRNEKSFFVKKTTAERPVNNDKVIIAAWFKMAKEPSSAIIIAINIKGIKMKASAITYKKRPA